MKVFVTGATGFIGGHLARKLRERGDEVLALARNPERARHLAELGCKIVRGDLLDVGAISAGMSGCDSVIHSAAVYKVGIPSSEHRSMFDTNVTGTEIVLGEALKAQIPKVVYVSTVGILGNTKGQVVDETYERQAGYTSYYEETKYLAHDVAKRLIARGLPCVIAMPGGVYGPGDQSDVRQILDRFLAGKMPAMALTDTGFTFVHVEDVVDGILAALDKGRPGESYVLGGEITTVGDLITKLANVAGRKPPRWTVPTGVLKAIAPAGPLIGKMAGFPPNLKELITASAGVTYWAGHDKARSELGYSPRPLEQGLRETLVEEKRI